MAGGGGHQKNVLEKSVSFLPPLIALFHSQVSHRQPPLPCSFVMLPALESADKELKPLQSVSQNKPYLLKIVGVGYGVSVCNYNSLVVCMFMCVYVDVFSSSALEICIITFTLNSNQLLAHASVPYITSVTSSQFPGPLCQITVIPSWAVLPFSFFY